MILITIIIIIQKWIEKILKVTRSKLWRRCVALFTFQRQPRVAEWQCWFSQIWILIIPGPAASHCSVSYSTSSPADHSVWTEALWLLPPDQGRPRSAPRALHWGWCRSECSHSAALNRIFSCQDPDIDTDVLTLAILKQRGPSCGHEKKTKNNFLNQAPVSAIYMSILHWEENLSSKWTSVH